MHSRVVANRNSPSYGAAAAAHGVQPSHAAKATTRTSVSGTVCRMLSAAELLTDLQSEPQFLQQFQDKGFQFIVSSHMLLHNTISKTFPLERACTSVSDSRGVFLRTAANTQADAAAAAAAPVLRVQTLRPHHQHRAALDWAHHTFAHSPFYCYSKSSLFTPDSSMTPHLELEMGATPGQSQVLLCISMDPKLSLTLSPEYLDQYYLNAPPSRQTQNTTNTTSSSSHHDCSSGAGTNGHATKPCSSWSELEAKAQGCPGFTRFTSPDLHVRAFASTAILFKVDEQGWPGAQEILSEALNIWLAWATLNPGVVDTPPLAVAAAEEASTVGQGGLPHTLPEDMAARSWAWRRFPRRERAAGMMKGIFGEQVMEDYWDSMAGAARIRL